MPLTFEKKLLPAVTLHDPELAVPLAELLLEEGLDTMEVAFRTEATAEAIRAISSRFPEMNLGAGTILSPRQVEEAIGAGARYGLAPGFNPTVLDKAEELDFPFIPGVMTPSEIEAALERNLLLQKLFPVNNLGGTDFIRSLQGPYRHTGVLFIPMGGINLSNLEEYLGYPMVAALGGSWLVPSKLLENRDFEGIRKIVRQSLDLVQA